MHEQQRHWILALGAAKGVVDPNEVRQSAAVIDQKLQAMDKIDSQLVGAMAALAAASDVDKKYQVVKQKWAFLSLRGRSRCLPPAPSRSIKDLYLYPFKNGQLHRHLFKPFEN